MGRVYAIKSSSVQWKNINKSTFSCKIFKAFFPLSSFVASQQMLGLCWTFVKSTSLESFSILISVGIRVSLQHTGPNIFYLLMQMILRNKVLQRQLILKLFNSVAVMPILNFLLLLDKYGIQTTKIEKSHLYFLYETLISGHKIYAA